VCENHEYKNEQKGQFREKDAKKQSIAFGGKTCSHIYKVRWMDQFVTRRVTTILTLSSPLTGVG
jgi:hypothetical protein